MVRRPSLDREDAGHRCPVPGDSREAVDGFGGQAHDPSGRQASGGARHGTRFDVAVTPRRGHKVIGHSHRSTTLLLIRVQFS
jgi:hypothetical protein